MTPAIRVSAALLILAGSSGCYTIGSPGLRAHPRADQIGSAGIRLESTEGGRAGGSQMVQPDPVPVEVLRERLVARGVRAVEETDEPAPGRVLVQAWVLGGRPTTPTRWTTVPWVVVHIASLGLIPYRSAEVDFLEVEVVDPAAPPERRIRRTRQSFVTVGWSWLPLLAIRPEGSGEEKAVRREGLKRALDEALDEVLVSGPAP